MPLHKLQLEDQRRKNIGQQNVNHNNAFIFRRSRRVQNTNQIITQADLESANLPPQFIPEPIPRASAAPHQGSPASVSVHHRRSRLNSVQTAMMMSLPVMLLLSIHAPSASGMPISTAIAKNSDDATGSSPLESFEPITNKPTSTHTPQIAAMMMDGSSLPTDTLDENIFPTVRATHKETKQKGYCSSMRLNSRQVLTAKHCTEGYDVQVETSEGKRINATQVIEHPRRDMAIVSLETELPHEDLCSPPISTENMSKTSLQECELGEGNYLLVGRGTKTMDAEVENTQLEVGAFNEIKRDTISKNQAYRNMTHGITQAIGITKDINAMQGDSGGPILQCNPSTKQLETVGVVHAVTYVEDDFDGNILKVDGVVEDYADYADYVYAEELVAYPTEDSAANPKMISSDLVTPISTTTEPKVYNRTLLELEEIDLDAAGWIKQNSNPCNGIQFTFNRKEPQPVIDSNDFHFDNPANENVSQQTNNNSEPLDDDKNDTLIISAVGATALGLAASAAIARKCLSKKKEARKTQTERPDTNLERSPLRSTVMS